jgi:uncharacterized protein (TIGR01777 family)
MTARPRIILTGANGLIGRALTKALASRGFDVVPLKSRTRGRGGMDIDIGWIDSEALEGAHAVIHLAGEPIAQRWTTQAKERILSSRAASTRLIAQALGKLKHPPVAFLCMSGVNRYGIHRPGETLSESSEVSNRGFLAQVSEAWERETQPAIDAGIRTVWLRTGMVLAGSGGALRKMRLPFSLGLGGPVGSGAQQISWIRLGDLVRLICWALETTDLRGPLNAVAPQPISQKDFARALAQTLRRPAFAPLPGLMVKTLFGQMGAETLLADLAVVPARALAGGFAFETPDLPSALRAAWCE